MKKYTLLFLLITATSFYSQERFGAGISLGFSFPVGDWSKVYNPGFGGDFSFGYYLEDNLSLYASIGVTNWSLDNEKFNGEVNAPGKFDLDGSVQALPVLIGLKWIFMNEGFSPFILIEAGLYNYSVDIAGKYIDEDGDVSIVSAINETFRESGFNFGLGFEKELEANLKLEIRGKYHLVSNGKTYDYGDGNNQYIVGTNQFISFSAGVYFKF
ncbi:MAG: porin family protein [Chlorobi bacterium]|nr:porin family protein [Chlorobiota bacterium]